MFQPCVYVANLSFHDTITHPNILGTQWTCQRNLLLVNLKYKVVNAWSHFSTYITPTLYYPLGYGIVQGTIPIKSKGYFTLDIYICIYNLHIGSFWHTSRLFLWDTYKLRQHIRNLQTTRKRVTLLQLLHDSERLGPQVIYKYDVKYIIQIYFGITSGRVLDGELLYTKILEGSLFAFAYRLFHEDFSPWREIFMKQPVGKCKQINF